MMMQKSGIRLSPCLPAAPRLLVVPLPLAEIPVG